MSFKFQQSDPQTKNEGLGNGQKNSVNVHQNTVENNSDAHLKKFLAANIPQTIKSNVANQQFPKGFLGKIKI